MTRAATENARLAWSEYYELRLRHSTGRSVLPRVAYVRIVTVDPGDRVGVAQCLTEGGETVVWPYGEIAPLEPGEGETIYWRAIDWGGDGGWVLDDLARPMSTFAP